MYDGSIVHEANRVLPEAPERLKESHRAFYRWTQAGESMAYGSSGDRILGSDEDEEFAGWSAHLVVLRRLREQERVVCLRRGV